ncbi:flavonol 3-sulfotransferase-like [Lycium ferocissimum]|uniref:flavonol 3-sulfotransferase-like n=1 Tax=Lycium ferocissimum TaxID=112874 RepID=UPI002814F5A8|nr:flavonol 3-sulfotransferase-like [Lycium ferocissimum]
MTSFISTQNSPLPTNGATKEEQSHKNHQEFPDIILSELPKERGWLSDQHVHQCNGFWYPTGILQGLIALQQHHYKPKPNDVLLASYPKSGTTWLKALLFSITNRAKYTFNTHPLLSSNPHVLVPQLEAYAFKHPTNPTPNSSLMHSHLAFNSLPESNCKIVYVFRDPKDVLASCWHFVQKLRPKDLPPISLREAFDQFTKGCSPFGPFWDHVMGYYKASLEFPKRVFFLKYEDLKKDPIFHAKRLAEFLGQPFSLEEESEGIAERITQLCSFEKLSNLEVNKGGTHTGFFIPTIANNTFFRQGKVGDSKNLLSKEMIEVLDEITKQKLGFDLMTTSIAVQQNGKRIESDKNHSN